MREKIMSYINSTVSKNDLNNCILNSNISEYDIKHAALSGIKFLYGEDSVEYNNLKNLPKEEYTVKIGLMMRSNKDLSKKMDELMIQWLNEFVDINNIKKNEFIENTRDSVLIWNKIPTKLKFKHCEFVNKEGLFSTFLRINNRYKILYDSLRSIIVLKGINKDIVSKSDFVHKTLKNSILSLEKRITHGYKASFQSLQNDKYNYLNSNNFNVYRELLNENQFSYINTVDNNVYYSDVLIKDKNMVLSKISNYNEFLLPIIRLGI